MIRNHKIDTTIPTKKLLVGIVYYVNLFSIIDHIFPNKRNRVDILLFMYKNRFSVNTMFFSNDYANNQHMQVWLKMFLRKITKNKEILFYEVVNTLRLYKEKLAHDITTIHSIAPDSKRIIICGDIHCDSYLLVNKLRHLRCNFEL